MTTGPSAGGAVRLRVVFMGTPEFAVPALAALVAAGHEIACVYCQPPRPAGRGHKPKPSPVQAFAEAHDLPVRTPATLRDAEAQAEFAAWGADVAVVAAYGLILPPPVLAAARLGCVNIHASLLPRWRGAAPIHRAMLAGDAETGITIMAMEAGLDTGPMLLRERIAIGTTDTAASLTETLAAMGGRMIVDALAGLAAGGLVPELQPAAGVTYAHKLTREDGRIDWRRPAAEIERQIRALTPWPGTWFTLDDWTVKLLAAEIVDDGIVPRDPGAAPGTVLDDRLTVACGEGALRLLSVQRPGRGAMDAAAFLRGFAVPPGTVLPAADDAD